MPEPYIRGYDRVGDTWEECSEVFFGRGDGALISTAADLALFFRALLVDRSLVGENLLAQMMTVVCEDPPADEAYGLGLIADPLPCGPVWGHAGGGFGYNDMPYVRIESGRFAVFMRNGSYGFRAATDSALGSAVRFSRELRATVLC